MHCEGNSLAAQAGLRRWHKDAGIMACRRGVDGVDRLCVAADVVKDLAAVLWVERGGVGRPGGAQHVGVPPAKAQAAVQVGVQRLVVLCASTILTAPPELLSCRVSLSIFPTQPIDRPFQKEVRVPT